MSIDYAGGRFAPRAALVEAHRDAWSRIGTAGDWWRAPARVAMIEEVRAAATCALCRERRAALSPNAVAGNHDTHSDLPSSAIDAVHRIVTDPGRLTRAWFDHIISSGLSAARYVELVSVVATTVVIDTTHRAMGLPLPPPPAVIDGPLGQQLEHDVVDDGAWLWLARRDDDLASATGLPAVPNIRRALSLVPSAPALFFRAFMPHYRLRGLDFAISQAQAEFVASRVSALNECFY